MIGKVTHLEPGRKREEEVEQPQPQPCPDGPPSMRRLAKLGNQPDCAGSSGIRDLGYQRFHVLTIEAVQKEVSRHQIEVSRKQYKPSSVYMAASHPRRLRAASSKVQHGLTGVHQIDLSARRSRDQLRDKPSIPIAQNKGLLRVCRLGQESCTPPLQFASEGGIFAPSIYARDGIAIHLFSGPRAGRPGASAMPRRPAHARRRARVCGAGHPKQPGRTDWQPPPRLTRDGRDATEPDRPPR